LARCSTQGDEQNPLAFKVSDKEEKTPMGYKWIKCHMIFDVKMDVARKVHLTR
jgi:hypothetical protein